MSRKNQRVRRALRRILYLIVLCAVPSGLCASKCLPNGSYPASLTRVGDKVFFAANDGVHGRELWMADGSSSYTRLVRDITPGSRSSILKHFTPAGDILYFVVSESRYRYSGNRLARGDLWKSDGTESGTVQVASFDAIEGLLVAGDGVFVSGAAEGSGVELWRSDGTKEGTVLLKDIYPGGRASMRRSLKWTYIGGQLVFAADDGKHGQELWITDGTPAGTRLLSDMTPGKAGTRLSELGVLGESLYLVAQSPGLEAKLHRFDGNLRKTTVASLGPDRVAHRFFPLDAETLLFDAFSLSNGSELWTTRGTEQSTYLVKDFSDVWELRRLKWHSEATTAYYVTGGSVFFTVQLQPLGELPPHPDVLWRSDGSSEGTEPLGPADGFSGLVDGTPLSLLDGGLSQAQQVQIRSVLSAGLFRGSAMLDPNIALFGAYHPKNGDRELWRTDGTVSGTFLFNNINSDSQIDMEDQDLDGVENAIEEALGSDPMDDQSLPGSLLPGSQPSPPARWLWMEPSYLTLKLNHKRANRDSIVMKGRLSDSNDDPSESIHLFFNGIHEEFIKQGNERYVTENGLLKIKTDRFEHRKFKLRLRRRSYSTVLGNVGIELTRNISPPGVLRNSFVAILEGQDLLRFQGFYRFFNRPGKNAAANFADYHTLGEDAWVSDP